MTKSFTLLDIFQSEQTNLVSRLKHFERSGIADLFNQMLDLMFELLEQVKLYSNSPEYKPSKNHMAIKTPGGAYVPNWNVKLFMHMLGSSLSQFIFATSHVFRGQALEAYGHVRRAIEGAGIVYLSVSEHNLGELYATADEYKLSERIPKSKILPKRDPLTRELNFMMKKGSSQLHVNLNSISRSIVEENYEQESLGARYLYRFSITDDMSMEQIWESSFYILTAAFHVARLYAASFNLPEGEWHKHLNDYKADLDRVNLNMKSKLNQSPIS